MRTSAVLARVLFAFAACAAAASAPLSARAAPDAPTAQEKREAAELKAQGDEAMTTLHYADALEAYVRAYAITADPALLYNQGRAFQALGQLPEALSKLEAFNEKAPAQLKARVPALDALLAEIRSKVARVTLASNVRGARVLVDNKVVGTTPLSGPLQLNAGAAVIQVEADGYLPYRSATNLPGGQTTAIEVKLLLKSTTGFLVINSRTKGAKVVVDDRAAGNVPVELPVSAGLHTVRVEREGFEPVKTSAVVSAGEKKQLEVPLAPLARPITSRWWFWTGIGVGVAAAAVTTAALLTEGSPTKGSILPGQLSAP